MAASSWCLNRTIKFPSPQIVSILESLSSHFPAASTNHRMAAIVPTANIHSQLPLGYMEHTGDATGTHYSSIMIVEKDLSYIDISQLWTTCSPLSYDIAYTMTAAKWIHKYIYRYIYIYIRIKLHYRHSIPCFHGQAMEHILWVTIINSLAPGKFDLNFRHVMFK